MKTIKEFKGTSRAIKGYKMIVTTEENLKGQEVDCMDVYAQGLILGTLNNEFVFTYENGLYSDSFKSSSWSNFIEQLKEIDLTHLNDEV